MPDKDQLIQQLMALLPQLLGGTYGGQGYSPYGSHMNMVNTGQLQTPMASQMLGGVFPGMRPQAGPTMTQADFLDMQARQRLQANTEQKFVFAPTLRRALSGMGFDMAQFQDPNTKKLTMQGMLATQLYNRFAGPALGDPYADRARNANVSRDIMSGVFFGRPGGQSGFGMSEAALERHVNSMTGMGKSPGLFKRSRFSAQDLFEAQSLGGERGLFTNAGEGDMTRRVEDMAGIIKTGMSVFRTMNKEKVLDMIQELTAGTVPVSNPGQLNRALFQISTMAKQANVSVEIMQRTAAEGASLMKRMGVGGTSGAMLAVGTSRFTQLASSKMGGLEASVDENLLARMPGGQRGFGQFMRQRTMSRMTSPHMMTNMFLMEESKRLGLMNEEQAGAFLADIKGGRVGGGRQREMIDAIAKARNMSSQEVINLMNLDKGRATERFMTKLQRSGRGHELDLMGLEFRFADLESTMTDAEKASLRTGVAETPEGRRQQVANIVAAEMRRSGNGRSLGLSEAQAQAYFEGQARLMQDYVVAGRNKDGSAASNRRATLIKELTRQGSLTQMQALGAEAREQFTQRGGTFAERVRTAIAGEGGIDPTSLMGALESVMMNDPNDPYMSYLNDRVARGEGITDADRAKTMEMAVKATRPENLSKFYAARVIMSRNRNIRGLEGQLIGLTGDRNAFLRLATGGKHLKDWADKSQEIIQKSDQLKKEGDLLGKIQQAGSTIQSKEALTNKTRSFFRERSINFETLSEFGVKELGFSRETARSTQGQAMALRAAQEAGLNDKSETFRGISDFLARADNRKIAYDEIALATKDIDQNMLRRIMQGQGSDKDIEQLQEFAAKHNLGVDIKKSADAQKQLAGNLLRATKQYAAQRTEQGELAQARFEDRGSAAMVLRRVQSRFLDKEGEARGKQIFEKFKLKGARLGEARQILRDKGVSGLAEMLARETGTMPTEVDLAATVGAIRGMEREKGMDLTKPEELRLAGKGSETLQQLLELKDQGKLQEAMSPQQILENILGPLLKDASETKEAAKQIAENTAPKEGDPSKPVKKKKNGPGG